MNLFLFSLLAHITGLTLAAGTTLTGFLVNRRFWKFYDTDRVKALTMAELGARFPRVIGIGTGLLLLSGFYMVYLSRGAYGGQLWFRIKILLVLAVIVNSFVAKALGKKVNRMIASEGSAPGLQQKVTVFYLVQLLLFLTIFVLGVFKFN